MIDAEVKRIVEKAYKTSSEIINKHKDALDKIARRLLEKETLDGTEVNAVLMEETGIDYMKTKEYYPTEGPEDRMTIAPGTQGAPDVPVPTTPTSQS